MWNDFSNIDNFIHFFANRDNFTFFFSARYCISMLAQKLNMDYDDAERWIVNLIRNARLDAMIDSKMGTVVMGSQHTSM